MGDRMLNLLTYLEQSDFNVECFVERIARQALGGRTFEDGTDACLLRTVFVRSLNELAEEYKFQQKRAVVLEKKCDDTEKATREEVASILVSQKVIKQQYKKAQHELDRIVAKTSFLGDILEAHDAPQSRLKEAESLIAQFESILANGEDDAVIQNDHIPLQEAEKISKLHTAASELLPNRYDEVRQKIAEKYAKVEQQLLAEMAHVQKKGDISRLREIISLLSNFRGYQACVDQFIVNAQKKSFIHPDLFQDALPNITKVSKLAQQIFSHPESVTGKFVDHVLRVRIKDYITAQLSNENLSPITERHLYLTKMSQLFAKTSRLCDELQNIPMDNATRNTLHDMPNRLFQPYLKTYQALEYNCMRTRLDALIRAYYQSVGHQKKLPTFMPLKGVRREIQSKMAPKVATFINVAPSVKDYGDETLICETLAVNSLQELRESVQRSTGILSGSALSCQIVSMFKLFLSKFVRDHLLYGINLAIKTIPVSQDLQNEPKHTFLKSVSQTNAIFHLVESIFTEEFLPNISGTSAEIEARKAKRAAEELLEDAISVGLKRSVKAYTRWIQIILSKQKYHEFFDHHASSTAVKVVAYSEKCIRAFEENLDGMNREHDLMDFGIRLHQIIFHNIRRFVYSHETGIGLLCDINEYRNVIVRLKIPILCEVFLTLQTLCNILVVPPENIETIMNDETMRSVDTQIIKDFIQLREDCKSNKLMAILFYDSVP